MHARSIVSALLAIVLLGLLPAWWCWHEYHARRSVEPVSAPVDAAAPDERQLQEAASSEPRAADESAGPQAVQGEPVRPVRPVPELITGPDPGRSPLADRLNAPEGDIVADLAIVARVLDNFLIEFGHMPVGANREITTQLSGGNGRRHAPLPRGHPSISPQGELLDRWGTPYFFHALSARRMEVRSAGADRELYSADDAVGPAPGS